MLNRTLKSRSDPQMTQIDADVKKWLSFVSLCLCARMGLQRFCTMTSIMSKMGKIKIENGKWKMESYKTGKQKKYTMGVQNEAEWCPKWFCCSAVRAGRLARNTSRRARALHRNSSAQCRPYVNCVNQKSRML